MKKVNLLLGLTVLAASVAIFTVPASAWFSSTGTQTGQTVPGTHPTFAIPGISVKCETASGTYEIQNSTEKLGSEKISEEVVTKIEQGATKPGPHLLLIIGKSTTKGGGSGWKECKATINLKEFAATVKHCNLQIEQISKTKAASLATGSVASDCVVETDSCAIKVPVEGNQHRSGVEISQSGTVGIAKAKIGSVNARDTSAACQVAGVTKSTSEGKFEGEVEGNNLELI